MLRDPKFSELTACIFQQKLRGAIRPSHLEVQMIIWDRTFWGELVSTTYLRHRVNTALFLPNLVLSQFNSTRYICAVASRNWLAVLPRKENTLSLFLTQAASSCTKQTESRRKLETATAQRIHSIFKIKQRAVQSQDQTTQLWRGLISRSDETA